MGLETTYNSLAAMLTHLQVELKPMMHLRIGVAHNTKTEAQNDQNDWDL